MTGFRLALGGAQEVFGIDPDLTCLGKIIGGGLPCAAFGGKARIMNLLAPLGPVYQAGTLSGNPLAMAAGIATLRYLASHAAGGLRRAGEHTPRRSPRGSREQPGRRELRWRPTGRAPWSRGFSPAAPVTDFATAAASDTEAFGRFHRAMLDQGVWLPPSQFEAAFLSTAHTSAELTSRWRPLARRSRRCMRPRLAWEKRNCRSLHFAPPDFLLNLVGSASFMRLSGKNKFSIKPRLVFGTAGSTTNRRVPHPLRFFAKGGIGDGRYRDSWYPTLRKKREGWGTRGLATPPALRVDLRHVAPTPGIHGDEAKPSPSPASSRIPVAASVTERSVPSCRWPPSCSRMLLPLCRRWLRRMPRCTRAASACGSVASQSWAVMFHITGVRPSSAAVRSTSGRRAPKGGRNHLHGFAGRILDDGAAAGKLLADARGPLPTARTDGSWCGSPAGGRLDGSPGQFRDAGAQSCQSGKRSPAPDGGPAIQAIAWV